MKCRERHRATFHSRRSSQCDPIDVTDNIVSSKLLPEYNVSSHSSCQREAVKIDKESHIRVDAYLTTPRMRLLHIVYIYIFIFILITNKLFCIGSAGYAYRGDNRNVYISPIDTYS